MDTETGIQQSMAFGSLLALAERAGVDVTPIALAYRMQGLAAAYEMFGYEVMNKQLEDNAADLRQKEGL